MYRNSSNKNVTNTNMLRSNLLSAQPGLGTQPHKEAPGAIWFKYVKTHWLALVQWGCPLDNNGLKMVMGQLNNSQKK